MFESRISARATEKLPVWEKSHAKKVVWSYDMEGHAQKCFQRYCDLANTKTEQLYKVSSPCLDDHQIMKEELESVGELSDVCSQTVLQARIGRQETTDKIVMWVTRLSIVDWVYSKTQILQATLRTQHQRR